MLIVLWNFEEKLLILTNKIAFAVVLCENVEKYKISIKEIYKNYSYTIEKYVFKK